MEGTDERMPLAAYSGSPAAAKAEVKCGQRGREGRWLWFCSELTAGEGNQKCLHTQVSALYGTTGEPSRAGRPETSALPSTWICRAPVVWVALRSNQETAFGHQHCV